MNRSIWITLCIVLRNFLGENSAKAISHDDRMSRPVPTARLRSGSHLIKNDLRVSPKPHAEPQKVHSIMNGSQTCSWLQLHGCDVTLDLIRTEEHRSVYFTIDDKV